MNIRQRFRSECISKKKFMGLYSGIFLLHLLFLFIVHINPATGSEYAVGADAGRFEVDNNGHGNWTLPILVPPGIGEMVPKLTVSLSTGDTNGLLGQGGQLSGLSSISRCTKTIAQDNIRKDIELNSDDAFCLDGNRLILTSGQYGAADSEYHTELESFQKIIARGSAGGSGPKYFEVHERNGSILTFGDQDTGTSSITTPGDGAVLEWRISKIEDINGNSIIYQYNNLSDANGIETHLETVNYGINSGMVTNSNS